MLYYDSLDESRTQREAGDEAWAAYAAAVYAAAVARREHDAAAAEARLTAPGALPH